MLVRFSDLSCGDSPAMPFDTFTLTPAEPVTLPAASGAAAEIVCTPSETVVVSQAREYGAAVSSAPTLTPSTLNCTPATPTLSLAVAVIVTVADSVEPPAGAVTVTDGA